MLLINQLKDQLDLSKGNPLQLIQGGTLQLFTDLQEINKDMRNEYQRAELMHDESEVSFKMIEIPLARSLINELRYNKGRITFRIDYDDFHCKNCLNTKIENMEVVGG